MESDRRQNGSVGKMWSLQFVVLFIQMGHNENGFLFHTTQMNSRWIAVLNVKATSLRCLEENVEEYLYDLRVVIS